MVQTLCNSIVIFVEPSARAEEGLYNLAQTPSIIAGLQYCVTLYIAHRAAVHGTIVYDTQMSRVNIGIDMQCSAPWMEDEKGFYC